MKMLTSTFLIINYSIKDRTNRHLEPTMLLKYAVYGKHRPLFYLAGAMPNNIYRFIAEV